jgi:hypothetical protein
MINEPNSDNGFVFCNLIRLCTFCTTELQHRIIAYDITVIIHCVMQWFSVWFTASAVIEHIITVAYNSHWIIHGIRDIFKMKKTLQ